MKLISTALFTTIGIFFISALVIAPLISNLGYSSVEGSYHAMTHALIISLIFVVIIAAFMISDAINEIGKRDDKNSE